MTKLEVLKTYFYYATTDRLFYFLKFFFLVLSVIAIESLPLFLGIIADQVIRAEYELAMQTLMFAVAVRFAGLVFSLLNEFFGSRAILNCHRMALQDFVRSVQMQNYTFHTSKSSGKLISLERRGASALMTAFIDINYRAVIVVIEFILILAVLFFLDPLTSLMILMILAVGLILTGLALRLNIRLRKLSVAADDKIMGVVVDNMIGFETVKIFAKEKWERNRLAQTMNEWFRPNWRYLQSFRLIDGLAGLTAITAFIFIYGNGINSVATGVITIGTLVTIFGFTSNLVSGVGEIIYKLRELAKSYSDLSEFFGIIKLNPEESNKNRNLRLEDVKGEIKVSNLTFKYDQGNQVLNKINLEIPRSATVAFVGESGAGKTTLSRILMGFYLPTEGVVTIDDKDISKIVLHDLRKSIGLVPQDPVLFNDTIAYNIGYAKDDSNLTEIIQAAKKAQLHNFIESLPARYDTIVGERGVKLSGGQRQRLAIARVILENPPIIIFDEATSQLDSHNENLIQQAFEELTHGKTTIIIAHRLSTLKHVDTIYLFADGNLSEQGNHAELVAKKGKYAKLWEIQTTI